jgi:hypothetical protein
VTFCTASTLPDIQSFLYSLLEPVGLAEIAGDFPVSADDPRKQRIVTAAIGQDGVKRLNSVPMPIHPIPFHTYIDAARARILRV